MENKEFDAKQVVIDQLKADFSHKHRECEKAAYALACELDVGTERNIAMELYEIIRTAPRAARLAA